MKLPLPLRKLDWLLLFVPIAAGLQMGHAREGAVFLCACLAVIPLAGLIGRATEVLAERAGSAVGGILNASLGNAAELIIAFFALRAGKVAVVKASITGSIIGNLLLVLGLSIVAGGARREKQTFNPTAAISGATMLALAVLAMLIPAFYHHVVPGATAERVGTMSHLIAAVLMGTYVAGLYFSLWTHKHLYGAGAAPAGGAPSGTHTASPLWGPLSMLVAASAATAWMSEILVGALDGSIRAFGFTETFAGVVVVAIIGNAAEHGSAVGMALKNKMDVSLNICIESSKQVALFVAPLLVWMGALFPQPMTLEFTPFEILAVLGGVGVVSLISLDGESNWLEGVQLLSLYLILAVAFYFVP